MKKEISAIRAIIIIFQSKIIELFETLEVIKSPSLRKEVKQQITDYKTDIIHLHSEIDKLM